MFSLSLQREEYREMRNLFLDRYLAFLGSPRNRLTTAAVAA